MTRDVVVIVGAGPGIGASVARRFARDGFAVGLIARTEDRLSRMAADLRNTTRTPIIHAAADATDPRELERALASITDGIGDPSVLCFSPIPDVRLIKPVLETNPEDFLAALALNVAGAAAAVRTVVPAMQRHDRGSLLFTTGSAALSSDPTRAASAVTTTAATAYISLLRATFADTQVPVGHTVIVGPIGDGPGSHDPDAIAQDLWHQHADNAVAFPSVLRFA